MKIRILGNSLRLRLSQTDINTLDKSGRVEERIQFPGGVALVYSLNTSEGSALEVEFEDLDVKTYVPDSFVREWVDTDRVGFEGLISLPSNEELKILIEKDFKCLTDRGEDESNLFANPNKESC